MSNTTNDFLDYNINESTFSQFDWTELAFALGFSLTFSLGLIGNVFIIISTLCTKLRPLPATPPNVFLGGLATADLVLIIFCILIKVAKLFSYTWTLGAFLCKSVNYIQRVSVICSAVMLTAMSIERYFAIIYPMKTEYRFTISQARKVVITIWVTSFFLGIPMIFVQTHKVYWCVRDSDAALLWRGHEVYMLVLILALPLTVMVFCYWKIRLVMKGRYHMTARHVLNSNNADTESISMTEMQNMRNDHYYREDGRTEEEFRTVKQVMKMLVAMGVVFTVCWGPVLIDNTLTAYSVLPQVKQGMYIHFNTAFQLMAFYNSCVNPIIYAFISNQFRKSFLSAFCGGLKGGHRAPMERHPSLSERCRDVEMWPSQSPKDGMPVPRTSPLQLPRNVRCEDRRLPLPSGGKPTPDRTRRRNPAEVRPDTCQREVNENGCIHLEFAVHGQRYHALVDTGATRSLLRSDLAELCRRVGDPWSPSQWVVRVANGAEAVTDGEIEVLATIDGQPIRHRYGVLPTLSQTILLGMDVLGQMGTSMRIGQHQWDCQTEAFEPAGPTE
ncbi:pyroglutamylated RF-amide peptide receptor-like [Osmia lignaria lignaria]|uniref:pyroglutamylated RF-amide peptide receptor-like n=1 Tax=Osmia lignaria lignaria TaxID=1437193 RepID=UPI00402B6986